MGFMQEILDILNVKNWEQESEYKGKTQINILKELLIHILYYINFILFPPAKFFFGFWTIFWFIGIDGVYDAAHIRVIIIGYIVLCGISDLFFIIYCFISDFFNFFIYGKKGRTFLDYKDKISNIRNARIQKAIKSQNISALKANTMLKRTNELANIANKTTDRDEFYRSINELKSILKELSKYEGKLPFIGSPSVDLRNLEHMEKSQIELLEKRIAEKEHHTQPEKNKIHETNKKIKHTTELEDIENKTIGFEYFFPPTSLLNKNNNTGQSLEIIKQRALKLIQTLRIFGVDADIVDIECGSRFTRYEIQIGKGVRIKDIISIKDDIKLILETTNLHIEAPITGRTTIGIDAENDEFSLVTLREIIESNKFMNFPSNLALAIGKDITGSIVTESLDNMCHLLIGGTIGSGKSVCISSIIMSILYKSHPGDVKLLLIDTKAVSLTIYNGIPHLMIPVVTDLRKSVAALQWAVNEMMERYGKFGAFGVRDLKGYNKVAEKRYPNDKSLQKMPRIVIIIDDFSDLMIAYNSGAEESICRLTQMGRAAGIHLVISTQRPSVDVITGTIKANIPSRIAFNVFSAIDSRTILDTKGAEDLLPDGDMLFYPRGARAPMRVQGAYVSDMEIISVINFLKNQMVGRSGAD